MCIQRRGYVHANDFFYRKNGRNSTRFTLERKVATTVVVLRFEFYYNVVRLKLGMKFWNLRVVIEIVVK